MATKTQKARKSPANPAKRASLTRLEQLPNVGPKIRALLRRLSVNTPQDLRGRDAYQMYQQLCHLDATRYDPCVLDVFISAVKFIEGGPARPWWNFTAQRKRQTEDLRWRFRAYPKT